MLDQEVPRRHQQVEVLAGRIGVRGAEVDEPLERPVPVADRQVVGRRLEGRDQAGGAGGAAPRA